MQLIGNVEEIIYRNEENGYTVAVVSHGEEYSTIVGKILKINIGENLKLIGEYIHTKYGEQFSFTQAEFLIPDTTKGMERYLGSGLIKGVGPVTSKLIVDKFKEEAFSVIEFAPQRLAEVKGISEKKATEIGTSFAMLKNLQNAVMFLQNYNITVNMALKICDVYKERTVEMVKENPYRLVEDVSGIGFWTADKIAGSMGISTDSPFRMRAGLIHMLAEVSEKNGHTYVPKKIWFNETSKLLNFELDEVVEAFEIVVDGLRNDKIITVLRNDKQENVMQTRLFFAETAVAQKLAVLNAGAISDNFNIDSEIKNFETINKVKLHEEQINAIQTAVNTGVSVITGGPGTGKTTIVRCIIRTLSQAGKKVLLVAPTGRASKRLSEATGIEAKTIHRALELEPSSDNMYFKYNESNPLPYNVVIVDEMSMVDVMLMQSLLRALTRDTKLIMVGDKDQLPSVSAGNVLGDIISSGVIKTCYLTQIFRQDEHSLIITNAHSINCGVMPILDNSSKDFFFERKNDALQAKESVVDMVTTRIPNFADLDWSKIQVLAPLKAGACGVESLNNSLQEKLNPEKAFSRQFEVGKTIFREGDKVMQTSNNYNLEWKRRDEYSEECGMGVFNGDIGFIHHIDTKLGEMEVWFEDGRECNYPRSSINELALAYAITIHKSQGSEFEVVVIPILSGPSMILTRNLIYTAVTRARKMVVLVGDASALKKMICNAYTAKRFTMLSTFLKEASKKMQEMFE